jgi:hypothetical protein
MRGLLLSVFVTTLVACQGTVPPPQPPTAPTVAPPPPASTAPPSAAPAAVQGRDGVACVGGVIKPPEGLSEAHDDALLAKAVDVTGKGKLCSGKVFEAVGKVTVYRVWNVAKDYTALGSWWSFSTPAGPATSYRADNAICPEWSELNRVSSCRIKVGAHVVVGPGQSAKCEHEVTYPKSATNQVFIPNDTRAGQVFVEDCTPGAPWP